MRVDLGVIGIKRFLHTPQNFKTWTSCQNSLYYQTQDSQIQLNMMSSTFIFLTGKRFLTFLRFRLYLKKIKITSTDIFTFILFHVSASHVFRRTVRIELTKHISIKTFIDILFKGRYSLQICRVKIVSL